MKKIDSLIMGLLLCSPAFTDTLENHESPGSDHMHEHAILSVADYDGSGQVTFRDLKMAFIAFFKGEYIAFYDRDANGALDIIDIELAIRDLGLTSTKFDRELARLFTKFGWLQNKS